MTARPLSVPSVPPLRRSTPARTHGTAAFGFLVVAATLLTPPDVFAQRGTTGDTWPVYGGDAGHTRYAPLDQIDASNVGTLEIAWRWTARNYGSNPRTSSQTTPLLVGGVLDATG